MKTGESFSNRIARVAWTIIPGRRINNCEGLSQLQQVSKAYVQLLEFTGKDVHLGTHVIRQALLYLEIYCYYICVS